MENSVDPDQLAYHASQKPAYLNLLCFQNGYIWDYDSKGLCSLNIQSIGQAAFKQAETRLPDKNA